MHLRKRHMTMNRPETLNYVKNTRAKLCREDSDSAVNRHEESYVNLYVLLVLIIVRFVRKIC